jgi:hypothetical protein
MLAVLKGLASTKFSEHKGGVLAAASAAALLIVLRSYFTSKESKISHNFNRIAKKVTASGQYGDSDFDEYDVIICGGGKFLRRQI